MSPRTLLTTLALGAGSLLLIAPAQAKKLRNIPNPDFTKGEKIPEGATKDCHKMNGNGFTLFQQVAKDPICT